MGITSSCISQSETYYTTQINKGTTYTGVFTAFKKQHDVLIAYSPTLSSFQSADDLKLTATTIDHLFGKICNVFQLDYVQTDEKSFLVRSEARDIEQSDDVMIHIRLNDSKDHRPIQYAALYDDSRKYYGFTDDEGDCFIKVPKNNQVHKFNIHSLAHQDKVIHVDTNVLFYPISLLPDPVKVPPVTINTLKKNLSFSKGQAIVTDHNILDKLLQSAVYQQDIMRAIQILPGVSAINDAKSGIRIRGANEEATLLVLDEMPIYKADHFFGIFGAFNAWYIKDVALYKNNIPVEFGGRTSGLVKLSSNKAYQPFQLNFDVNLLNSGLYLHLPTNKNFALTLSGRTSYTQLTKSNFYNLSERENIENPNALKGGSNQITSNPAFDFYDLNGKIQFNKDGHSIEANVFTSRDHFDDNYDITYKVRNNEFNDELFDQVSQWQNLAYGLNYTYVRPSVELKFSGYYTSHFNNYDIVSHLVRKEKNVIIKDTIIIFNRNKVNDIGMKLGVGLNKYKNLKIGMEHIVHDNELYLENDKNPIFEINKKASESSLFAQVSMGDKTDFMIEPAIRTTVFHSLGSFYFLPQIYLSKSLGNNMLIKGAAGRQAQLVRLFEHENALGQKQQFFALSNNKNVPVGISTNTMIGMWKTFGNLSLDVEAYYRVLDGAIIHATQMPGLRPPQSGVIANGFLIFKGKNQTYGVDIAFSYEHRKYFSIFTYTLSKSENKFPALFRNQPFPSSEDARHQLKWINTLNIGSFDISATYIGASGRPYLDLSSIRTPIERATLIVDKYIRTLPAYHRIDLGLHYKFKLFQNESKIGISVFNIANRINVKYRQFVYQLPALQGQTNPLNTVLGSDVAQLERTLNLNFNVSIR